MKDIFDEICNATNVADLNAIVITYDLTAKIISFKEKYPDVDLTFSQDEVRSLLVTNTLTDKHLIDLSHDRKFSAFEKLLLSVLWKNGHLTRVQPIVDGMVGDRKSESKYGVIFQQFGRSLVDEMEPIIDQHVLRAFSKFGDLSRILGRKTVQRNTAFNDADQETIDAYREWFKDKLKHVNDSDRTKFKYLLDKILFVVGKSIE